MASIMCVVILDHVSESPSDTKGAKSKFVLSESDTRALPARVMPSCQLESLMSGHGLGIPHPSLQQGSTPTPVRGGGPGRQFNEGLQFNKGVNSLCV